MRFMSHYFGFCFATLKLDYTCLRLLYLNCFIFRSPIIRWFLPESMRGNVDIEAEGRGMVVLHVLVLLVCLY